MEQDFRVLEVFNPDVAKKVLTRNQRGGFFLPCKIVVYRNQETLKTDIGLLRPTTQLALTEDDQLKPLAEDVEETLIQAINEAK